jgi:CPA2 family monovalent cation:H+ antiporter-2
VVVTYQNTASALKVLANVRAQAPTVPVIVRTVDDHDLEKLQHAGATEVVPEAIEGSLMLASHALALVGVPMRRVLRVVQDQRDARYNLLRGYFHGADDDSVNELEQARLSTVTLPTDSKLNGKTWSVCAKEVPQVRIVSLRRSGGEVVTPSDTTVLESGDTLVLSGMPEDLALAQRKLLRGVH